MNIKLLLYILKQVKDKKGLILYSRDNNIYNIVSVIIFRYYVVLVPADIDVPAIDIRKLVGRLINADTEEIYILWKGCYYEIIDCTFKDNNLILY